MCHYWLSGQMGEGREALLFVLEEESDPRRFSIHRLAHYCLDLAELCGTDRVVPVVIFLKTSSKEPRELVLGSERYQYLNFNYIRCALQELSAKDYWHSNNLIARLCLILMSWRQDQKLEVYARAVRGLSTLEPDPEKQLKYLDFIDIYTALDDNEMELYQQKYPKESSTMANLSDRLRAEGMEKGMLKGMEKGLEKGLHEGMEGMLRKQVQLKFGPIPLWADERISTATNEQLEIWVTAILSEDTLEALLALRG